MPKGQYTRRGRPPAEPVTVTVDPVIVAEAGETIRSSIVNDPASFASPAPEPFGGKGDHDGDGKVGGAHPPIDAPVAAVNEAARAISAEASAAPDPTPKPAPVAPVKLVTVKLLRNYRPAGAVEIVGYHKPAVMIRNVAGKEVEVSPSVFVEGEVAPPPQAGVGFATKLWAGTVIRLPVDEAKRVKANGIGEIEID